MALPPIKVTRQLIFTQLSAECEFQFLFQLPLGNGLNSLMPEDLDKAWKSNLQDLQNKLWP